MPRMSIEQIEEYLASHVSERTLEHCRRVSVQARQMAERFGADEEQAALAGLCHDCAKMPGALETALQCGIELDEYERGNRELPHAKLGAYIAEHIFGIGEEEILDSIRYHTVGRADMTVLDKIIYLADCIEPARDYPGVEAVRDAAERDLDKAVRLQVINTLAYLLRRERIIHPNSVALYNALTGK